MRILRILKGIGITAVLWAIAWVPLTFGLFLASRLFGAPVPPGDMWALLVYRQFVTGAMTGAAFALALAVLGRTRTVATLGYGRMAVCGALGGIVFPAFTTIMFARMGVALPVLPMLLGGAISASAGALCATGSLRLARRAPELSSADPAPELGVGGV